MAPKVAHITVPSCCGWTVAWFFVSQRERDRGLAAGQWYVLWRAAHPLDTKASLVVVLIFLSEACWLHPAPRYAAQRGPLLGEALQHLHLPPPPPLQRWRISSSGTHPCPSLASNWLPTSTPSATSCSKCTGTCPAPSMVPTPAARPTTRCPPAAPVLACTVAQFSLRVVRAASISVSLFPVCVCGCHSRSPLAASCRTSARPQWEQWMTSRW